MKLAVTGALGHIGSRLIRSLAPEGLEEVLLVDDLSAQRYCSLFDLPPGIPFRFVQADVRRAELSSLLAGMDAVVHLAAITDAESSVGRAREVEEVNYEGAVRVASACAALGARMVFPSTTSVYGVQDGVVDERCPRASLRPQSPYAESKLRAEEALATLAGLRCVRLRLGTIFGTSIGMRFHTAVNKFVWQACAGLPLTVWRTALHQRRPYLELGDAVAAIQFVLEGHAEDGGLYNVVTANATVAEIVERIRALVPDTRVELVDSPIMNQLSYAVDASRFAALGFEFRGALDQGIGETVRLLGGLAATRRA